ncbi:MAG: substrate-binding domain-containing protein [Streptosporangiaceae bacterium]
MNGRPPGDNPGEGAYGSSAEYPTADSTDWFSPRAAAGPSESSAQNNRPDGYPAGFPAGSSGQNPTPGSGAYPAQQPPADADGSQPEWFTPRAPSPYGSGGFTGASDPGGVGYGPGQGPASSGSHQDAGFLGAPVGSSGSAPTSNSYDRPFPTGPGQTSGSYDSGDGGSGDYSYGGSGSYGSNNRKKRKKSALIGPIAGAVGLALLLGVAVYAFAKDGGGNCSGTAITLNVSVAPEILPAVQTAAKSFTDSQQAVGDSCVIANVTKADPAAVKTVLAGEGQSDGVTKKPDVWIPDTSLWSGLTKLISDKSITSTGKSIATTPIVVAVPQSLAVELKDTDVATKPSWDNLLSAAGGLPGGAVTKNQLISPKLLNMKVLNPTSTGPGMAAIAMLRTLLQSDPAADTIFTGIVRTIRDHTSPNLKVQYSAFHKDARGRYPLLITPEQSVAYYNAKKTKNAEGAVAIYPEEGLVSMDYPVTVTTNDSAKIKAAALLETALTTPAAVKGYQALGFRTPDRKAPETFSEKIGLTSKRIRSLPAGDPKAIYKVTQDWEKLSLAIRMLAVLDVSGTMVEKLPGSNVTRMQAITQIAAKGLALFPPDTDLGIWTFSTNLVGKQDWRENVPVAPLNKRNGSVLQRDKVLTGLAAIKALPTGDTGLYDTILGAYRSMKKNFAADKINTVLVMTDGVGNDDKNGISLAQLNATLKKEMDPNRQVQVVVISIGSDQNVLRKLQSITRPTGGEAYVAKNADEIAKIFLQALSRRMTCNAATAKC